MLCNKSVAVVIPCYNEENQIREVLKTIPRFVDRIIVVNDMSTDGTEEIVKKLISKENRTLTKLKKSINKDNGRYGRADDVVKMIEVRESEQFVKHEIRKLNTQNSRIILINHLEKGVVGGAISTGYKWCRDNLIDCTAVMAGDGQMDPSELEGICTPVVKGEVDYVKANRLSHRSALFVIPRIRFFGNSILSLFTKIASGYWHVSDTQTGYTAIGFEALKAVRIHKIYRGYGCPNDILVKLNISFCTIKEVPSKPVYDIGERSKMNELKVVPKILWLLFKSFWVRLYVKYLFRDFHPLFLLYHTSFALLVLNVPFTYQALLSLGKNATMPMQSLILFTFFSISGLQLLFFAMWMDMIDNERLQR